MPEIPSDKPDDAYLSTRGGLEPEGRVPGQAAALKVQPHRDALRCHILLHLVNAEGSKVKDACRQHGVGLTLDHALGKMLERTHATARDDGESAPRAPRRE